MAAAFAVETFLGFPSRRIGHGFGHSSGHGLTRFLAFHTLFRHGVWSIFVMIGILIAVGFFIRWIVRSRQRRNTGDYWG